MWNLTNQHYLSALREYESGNIDEATLARARVEVNFDDSKVKQRYVELSAAGYAELDELEKSEKEYEKAKSQITSSEVLQSNKTDKEKRHELFMLRMTMFSSSSFIFFTAVAAIGMAIYIKSGLYLFSIAIAIFCGMWFEIGVYLIGAYIIGANAILAHNVSNYFINAPDSYWSAGFAAFLAFGAVADAFEKRKEFEKQNADLDRETNELLKGSK